MNRIKQVISVAIAVTLSITTLKLDKVEANPITAPACRDVPSCGVAGVIIGTEIIGGVLYYIVENAQGVVHKVRKKRGMFPPPDEHGMIDLPRVPGGGYTQNQCILLAAQADRELGGKWEPRFITVDHNTGLGHCSLQRIEENKE